MERSANVKFNELTLTMQMSVEHKVKRSSSARLEQDGQRKNDLTSVNGCHCCHVFNCVRLCLILFDCVQFCLIVFACVRLCTIVYDCVRLCTTVYDCVRLCTIVYDCVRYNQLCKFHHQQLIQQQLRGQSE